MKKFLVSLVSLCFALTMAAQTYNAGTWYSYYNAAGIELNTIDNETLTGFYYPAAGTLTFNSLYTKLDLSGVFAKCKTSVFESTDGGSTSASIGIALPDVELKHIWQSYDDWDKEWNNSLSCSRAINWLKFDRATGNTHIQRIYNIAVPLAQHILLPSGEYGATEASHDFGSADALSLSTDTFHVSLRSFLSAADITISASDHAAFRINSSDNINGWTFAVGANACASPNGTADVAAEGQLGNIANYGFDILFTPQEGKEYNETVTVSDGVSSVVISVTGLGIKLNQSITWEQEDNVILKDTDAIVLASASSGLDVQYAFEPEGILSFADGKFIADSIGAVTITASQPGNEVYNPAAPVAKSLTIIPSFTYYAYADTICQGGVYSDVNFSELTEANQYLDTLTNQYGTDSIITFTLVVNPTYAFDDGSREIYVATPEVWQGVDLSLLPVGDTTLVVEYATIAGCDSIFTLHLSVVERPTTYGEENFTTCAGNTVEYAGRVYSETTEKDSILIDQKNTLGGDSIVVVNVVILPVPAIEEEPQTVIVGMPGEWQGIDLSTLPVGDTTLVATFTASNGCDSTRTVLVSVLTPPTTYGEEQLTACAGASVEYEGKVYTRPVKNDSVLIAQKNMYGGDSIVVVTVSMRYGKRIEDGNKTVIVGMPGEWQGIDLSVLPLGDTTLVATYTAANGCDSTFTVNITVVTPPTTFGEELLTACEGATVEYEGKVYSSNTVNDSILIAQKNMYGGDSIVVVSVQMLSPTTVEEDPQTVIVGMPGEWQGIDLSLLPVGDTTLVANFTASNGCDSTRTVLITVLTPPTTFGEENLSTCAGNTVEYAGKVYSETTVNDSILIAQKNSFGGDSIVVVNVTILPSYDLTDEPIVMEEGTIRLWEQIDLSTLPVGDTTLVATFTADNGCDSTRTVNVTVEVKSSQAIDATAAGDDKVQKIIVNGRLYIRKGDSIYDAVGIKVDEIQ